MLPEKWCVKNTNLCLFNKIDKIGIDTCYIGNSEDQYYYIVNDVIEYSYDVPKDYTEIPFEDFERYVLNKEDNITEDMSYLIPILKQLNIE